jgi:ribonuclease III
VNRHLSTEDYQTRLGLQFRDEALLWRALTHRSWVNEHPLETAEDNERLEFLGDAIIEMVVSEYLYKRFPDLAEGKMTRLRAGLVRRESLAAVARSVGIGELLRLGKGEEEHGGRERDTNLCGAFEAVNGALYLDQGIEAVRAFVLPRLQEHLHHILREDLDKDAKSRLQEWSQFNLNLTPSYRVAAMEGPEHARSFTIEVLIGDLVYGVGMGSSKRHAEQEAARIALESLEDELSEEDPAAE